MILVVPLTAGMIISLEMSVTRLGDILTEHTIRVIGLDMIWGCGVDNCVYTFDSFVKGTILKTAISLVSS